MFLFWAPPLQGRHNASGLHDGPCWEQSSVLDSSHLLETESVQMTRCLSQLYMTDEEGNQEGPRAAWNESTIHTVLPFLMRTVRLWRGRPQPRARLDLPWGSEPGCGFFRVAAGCRSRARWWQRLSQLTPPQMSCPSHIHLPFCQNDPGVELTSFPMMQTASLLTCIQFKQQAKDDAGARETDTVPTCQGVTIKGQRLEGDNPDHIITALTGRTTIILPAALPAFPLASSAISSPILPPGLTHPVLWPPQPPSPKPELAPSCRFCSISSLSLEVSARLRRPMLKSSCKHGPLSEATDHSNSPPFFYFTPLLTY